MMKVDFYLEHSRLIKQKGYVDLAKFGKRRISSTSYSEKCIFIKESKEMGGRLFKAELIRKVDKGVFYPSYYNNIKFDEAEWFRIKSLKEIDKNDFLQEYTLSNGKYIEALNKGSTPFFFVKRAKNI